MINLHFILSVFNNPTLDYTTVFPIPVEKSGEITIRLKDEIDAFTVAIYDEIGKVISNEIVFKNTSYAIIKAPKSSGVYTAIISYTNSKEDLIRTSKRIMVN